MRESEVIAPLDRPRQGGAVVVFFLIFAAAMVALLGLVIDLGRLEFAYREAQNAADAASLAAVNELRGAPPPLPPAVTEQQWRHSKLAVPAALSATGLFGLDSAAAASLDPAGDCGTRFAFAAGTTTTPWDYMFGSCNNTTDTGQAGNLTVKVTRGVQCLDAATHTASWLSLERSGAPCCAANSVRVDVEISGITTFFAGFFGASRFRKMAVSATAQMESYPPDCEKYTCQELRIVSDDDFAACDTSAGPCC